MTKKGTAKTVFVLSRLNWRPGNGGWWLAPGAVRLASFATRDEAEGDRIRREANARKRVNPFRCGKPLAELTTLPEPIFLDWLADTGLSAPKPGKKNAPRDWAAWWDATRPQMSAEQHARLWEGLNRLCFFRVDERPDIPVGYAVVSLNWQYNDEYHYLNSEGGAIEAVYRTRERALEEGRQRSSWMRGSSADWLPSGSDLFDPETYWELAMSGGPQFDIVEIELEGLQ
jgi:hypothetical protein